MAEWSIAAVLKTVVPRGTRGSNPCLSAGKNCKTKKIPVKLILYGDFLFLVHGKNKHIKAFFRCTIRCTWSYAYICDIFMLSKKIKNFSKKTTTFLKKNRNFFKNVLVFFFKCPCLLDWRLACLLTWFLLGSLSSIRHVCDI